jgi:hypothetical protein
MTSAACGSSSDDAVFSASSLSGASTQRVGCDLNNTSSLTVQAELGNDLGKRSVVGSVPSTGHSLSIYSKGHDYEELPSSRCVKFAGFLLTKFC